jgi:hypothetical protein
MSQLFGRERSVSTKHVWNVFRERELEPGATCAKFAQVQTEGLRTDTREATFKYGYPPHKQKKARHTVLKQAEALSGSRLEAFGARTACRGSVPLCWRCEVLRASVRGSPGLARTTTNASVLA